MMPEDIIKITVEKQLNADLVETKACYRILEAENKELIEVCEDLISVNDDAAKLKAKKILMKVKQAKAKP